MMDALIGVGWSLGVLPALCNELLESDALPVEVVLSDRVRRGSSW